MVKKVHSAVHDIVEELPILRVLHNNEDAVGRFHDLVQLGDGGVPDQFEDVQLSGDALDIGDVLYLVLLEDLDRHWLARVPVDRLLHLAESAPPDRLPPLEQLYSIR